MGSTVRSVLLALGVATLIAAPADGDVHAPAPADPFQDGKAGSQGIGVPGSGPNLSLELTGSREDMLIPWHRLERSQHALVRDIVGRAVFSREVRDIAFRSRKEIFEFLLDHPDFASDVARLAKQGKYRVRRVGDMYAADDGRHARGTFKPVLVDGGLRVFHLEGRYDPPLLPTLAGSMVLLLDSAHVDGPDGLTYCALTVAGYLKAETTAVEVLAALTGGFVGAYVDRTVRQFFRYVAGLSRRAYDDPEGLAQDVARQPDLPAELVTEFRRLLMAHVEPSWAEGREFSLLASTALTAAEIAAPLWSPGPGAE